jgi:hypothetical protein
MLEGAEAFNAQAADDERYRAMRKGPTVGPPLDVRDEVVREGGQNQRGQRLNFRLWLPADDDPR